MSLGVLDLARLGRLPTKHNLSGNPRLERLNKRRTRLLNVDSRYYDPYASGS